MPIKYIGPQTLKGVFEKEYHKISKHYDREEPLIVVGLPTLLDFLDEKAVFQTYLERYGLMEASGHFSTQREFNDYVDTRIARLNEIRKRASKVKKSKYKVLDQLYQEGELAFKEVFKELAKTSFVESRSFGSSVTNNPLAAYDVCDDCIHADVYGSALYFFGGVHTSHVDFIGPTNLPKILRHELVHHALGNCEPFIEMRSYHQESMYFLMHLKKWHEAAEKGVEAIRKWREEDGGEEFLLRLRKAQGEITLEGFVRETEKNNEKIKEIESKSKELGIDIGNEALAYVYITFKDGFRAWLEQNHPQEPKALDLYDSLERRINQQGKLKTLREVRESINTAYSSDKNLLSLI